MHKFDGGGHELSLDVLVVKRINCEYIVVIEPAVEGVVGLSYSRIRIYNI